MLHMDSIVFYLSLLRWVLMTWCDVTKIPVLTLTSSVGHFRTCISRYSSVNGLYLLPNFRLSLKWYYNRFGDHWWRLSWGLLRISYLCYSQASNFYIWTMRCDIPSYQNITYYDLLLYQIIQLSLKVNCSEVYHLHYPRKAGSPKDVLRRGEVYSPIYWGNVPILLRIPPLVQCIAELLSWSTLETANLQHYFYSSTGQGFGILHRPTGISWFFSLKLSQHFFYKIAYK